MNWKTLAAVTALATFAASQAFADVVPQTGLVDDQAPGWIRSGMRGADGIDLHDGTAHAGGPGSYAAYTNRKRHAGRGEPELVADFEVVIRPI
jgi:hypothetical protein